MSRLNRVIDKKIENKFNLVENKLRNSFQEIKQENTLLKNLLTSFNLKFLKFSKQSISKKEVSEEITKSSEKIFIQTKQDVAKLEIFLKENQEKLNDLSNEVSKQNIKQDIKQEISKEIKTILKEDLKNQNKNSNKFFKKEKNTFQKEFRKYCKRSESLKKEFLMFKHEFVALRDDWENTKENLGRELKDLLNQTEKNFQRPLEDLRNQITSLKARNTVLTRELNNLKGNGSKELMKELKFKSKKEKKSFLNKLVDSLSD